jgi:hypothetical protein
MIFFENINKIRCDESKNNELSNTGIWLGENSVGVLGET